MYIMKKRKWERWMAGACLLVLLGSFFSPMAVGTARAEMDSAEEILSTLGTSPAKIYANYITGIDRVVEDAEGKLLYDAMLSEPESYFLCMTLDDDLGLSADVAVWYDYLMEGDLSDISEHLLPGSYEAGILLDILLSNSNAFSSLELETGNVDSPKWLEETLDAFEATKTILDQPYTEPQAIQKADKWIDELMKTLQKELGLKEKPQISLSQMQVFKAVEDLPVGLVAEFLVLGLENGNELKRNVLQIQELYAQRDSMITLLRAIRENCVDDEYLLDGIDIILDALLKEDIWESGKIWEYMQGVKLGSDIANELLTTVLKMIANGIPALSAALSVREVLPIFINLLVFDFDEFNGQVRTVEVTGRFAEALIATVKTLNAQYEANPTEENARKCVEAFEMMYRLALYDKDLYGTFAQSLLRSGALTALVKDASGEKYSGILENLDEMREDIKDSHARVERVVDAYTSFQVEKLIKEYANVQTKISAGGLRHSAGVRTDGTVVTTEYQRSEYDEYDFDVEDWSNIVAVEAGGYHCVGLRADGSVVATGEDMLGQCYVSDWRDIIAIAAGDLHTLGLYYDGTVLGVGEYLDGRLAIEEWHDIVAIAAGAAHSVGLCADGTVVVASDNRSGEGNVSRWRDIVAISAGNSYTVGLRKDGTVLATGSNGDGQCDVSSWKNIVAISAGDRHTVGLRADGTVVAVGYNDTNACDVDHWTDIVAVSAGYGYTIGLRADGTMVATDSAFSGCDVTEWRNIECSLNARQVEIDVKPQADEKYFEYTLLADGGVRIDRYTGRAETLVVPATLGGHPVREIGAEAFQGCQTLVSIALPDGIVSVGEKAFYLCDALRNVELPKNLNSLGDGAFWLCETLEEISLPDGLVEIAPFTFWGCKKLTSISLPAGLISIGREAFAFCEALPSVTLPDNLLSIGPSAFAHCASLSELTLPDALESIGENAFQNCVSLKMVSIPDGLRRMGNNPFSACESLVSFAVPQEHPCYATIEGVLYEKATRTLIAYPAGRDVYAFEVPAGIEAIGNGAFSGCYLLNAIFLPDSLVSIGEYAFEKCVSLGDVALPTELVSIGSCAFDGCESLRSIVVPNGVTMGDGVFNGCVSLQSVTLPDTLTVIGEFFFNDCLALNNIDLPSGIVTIGTGAFMKCPLISVALPQGLVSIGDSAFSRCTSLCSVALPDSVLEIDTYAFNGCNQLIMTVVEGSYAHQYAIEQGIFYRYADAGE